jgi:hypothetical protein
MRTGFNADPEPAFKELLRIWYVFIPDPGFSNNKKEEGTSCHSFFVAKDFTMWKSI